MISEFPLFAFTMFSGVSAGFYLAAVAFSSSVRAEKRPWLLRAVCLVLLGIGLLGTLAHLGQPVRFLNALAHPSAPIALEAYCSMAFGALLAADLICAVLKRNAPKPLRVAAAVAGFALIAVTGYAYFQCYGIPAWASLATLPLFALGDIAMGCALALLLDGALFKERGYGLASGIVYAAYAVNLVCLAAWFAANGQSWVWIAVSLIGPIGCGGLLMAARKGLVGGKVLRVVTPVLMIAAVAVVRYAFYSVPSL